MDRKVITLIILLTSVSLVAALTTQLFWVRDAWSLKEDQFNKDVKLSLKRITTELMAYDLEEDTTSDSTTEVYADEFEYFFSVINPEVLDSLLNMEFEPLIEKGDYSYGVYLDSADKIVYGNYTGNIDRLKNSPHQESLTCVCQDQNYILAIYIPDQRTMLLNKIIILPVMSGLFLIVLLFSFFLTIYFIFKQKKLSEMKTDFVNNMTHELKTPIATINVSAEMLTKEHVIHSPEKIRKYSGIISEENSRLQQMVDRVLQIALIDKEDYHVKMKEHDVHKIIQECVNKYMVQVKERKGNIHTNLSASHYLIMTDQEHLTNILYNLLDNANKYSPVNPSISVDTFNQNGTLHISVHDKGIGISKENYDMIFRKFQRLQHGDIHDVKGYGIGLFYVKTMVEKLGGNIELQSEVNKGSNFILSFPV